MNTALHIISVLWPYLAGGSAITVFSQLYKRLLKLEKNWVIRFMVTTFTIVYTGLTYIVGNHGISGMLLLLHGGTYGYLAEKLYPLTKRVDGFLTKVYHAMQIVSRDVPAIEKVVNDAAASLPQNTTVAQNTNKVAPAAADF